MSEFQILIVCGSPVALSELSPDARRALAFARLLGREFRVALAAPGARDLADSESFDRMNWAERQAFASARFDLGIAGVNDFGGRWIPFASRWIADIWRLDSYRAFCAARAGALVDWLWLRRAQRKAMRALRKAQFLLCASGPQLDFWIGGLYATGRFRDRLPYGAEHLNDLGAFVPFGWDDAFEKAADAGAAPPQASEPAIVWADALDEHLDPYTAIRAVKRVARERPGTRLAIPVEDDEQGLRPSAGRGAPASVRAYARAQGALNECVTLAPGAVADIPRLLAGAQLAISLSGHPLENRYSFRTRLLECLRTGTPLVCVEGGFWGEFVTEHGIGRTAPMGDSDAVAAAILSALDPHAQDQCRANMAKAREALRWERAAAPLAQFCRREQRRIRAAKEAPHPNKQPSAA